MKVRTLTRGVSQEDKPVAPQSLPCKLGSGKLVHKVAVICLKTAPNIASSQLSCSRTWSATALSRNATRSSRLNCLRNTADSCAQFFQNIGALKSRQLEMVSWPNFPALWRRCNAGLKYKR